MARPLSEQTAVVTGCTSGVGKAAAHGLAGRVSHLILVGRSPDKLATLHTELASSTGGKVRLSKVCADLGIQTEVRRAAAEVCALAPTLDILVNNAGVYNQDRKTTVDGFEETFAVNHLGYFLFTLELLGVLQAAGNARVVNVASEAHRAGSIRFEDLDRTQGYGQGWGSYGQSKLANILFTRELARRLPIGGAGPQVVAHCMHPGFVNSGFARNNGFLGELMMTISRPFQRSPEKAADTVVWLATDPTPGQSTGGYWIDRKLKKPTAAGQDAAAAARLWALSLERCKMTDPLPN